MVDLQDIDHIRADISDFLVRSVAPVEGSDLSAKKPKSKFAIAEKPRVESPKSESSIGLSTPGDQAAQKAEKTRTSILKIEEEGDLFLVDDTK